MAGVMTREEPLIKQLVRSRALKPRDHSSSPTRGRSPIQKYSTLSSNSGKLKHTHIQQIRSMSQPPSSNQHRLYNGTKLYGSQNISSNDYCVPVLVQRMSQYHMGPLRISDKIQFQASNKDAYHSPKNSLFENTLSMSISQPNLAASQVPNHSDLYANIYPDPGDPATRWSSVSTLPPSSSMCGSPIQPTLLSPLNLSRPSTPIGSCQNISLVPILMPLYQDSGKNANAKKAPEINVTIQKNTSCNSIYTAPEDVFHLEQYNGSYDHSKSSKSDHYHATLNLDHETTTSQQTSSQLNLSSVLEENQEKRNMDNENVYMPIDIANQTSLVRRGSLLPIFEQLHFNDAIDFSGSSSLPLYFDRSNMISTSEQHKEDFNCSYLSDVLLKDMDELVFFEPNAFKINKKLQETSCKHGQNPGLPDTNLNFSKTVNLNNISYNPTEAALVAQNHPNNKNHLPQESRDAWRSALEAEREYSSHINRKYNISDGNMVEESDNYIIKERNDGLNYRIQETHHTFPSHHDNVDSIGMTHPDSNLGYPRFNRSSEKAVHLQSYCTNPACQCFSNLYCKICNLLGPYNGSGVQKISLFAVSANILECHTTSEDVVNHHARSDSSLISENVSSYVGDVSRLTRMSREIQPMNTNVEKFETDFCNRHDEASIQQAKKRKRGGSELRR